MTIKRTYRYCRETRLSKREVLRVNLVAWKGALEQKL